jgi:hypothetical protein
MLTFELIDASPRRLLSSEANAATNTEPATFRA